MVVVTRMEDWMTPFPPPHTHTWSAYRTIMACRLVALDKRPGMRPTGIGETLRRALDKIIMREAEDQAKTVCGNLQLRIGLETSIEDATHAVGQRRLERLRVRRGEEKARRNKEEESVDVEAGEERLTVVMAATEE